MCDYRTLNCRDSLKTVDVSEAYRYLHRIAFVSVSTNYNAHRFVRFRELQNYHYDYVAKKPLSSTLIILRLLES